MGKTGFSLLELLVVLVLIGLSALFVLPSIGRGLGKLEVRRSALKLAAVVRDLRSKAIYEGAFKRLVLNRIENSYSSLQKVRGRTVREHEKKTPPAG